MFLHAYISVWHQREKRPINAMSNEPIIITYPNHDILTASYGNVCVYVCMPYGKGKRFSINIYGNIAKIHSCSISQIFSLLYICVCFSAQTNIYKLFFFISYHHKTNPFLIHVHDDFNMGDIYTYFHLMKNKKIISRSIII